MWGAGCLVALIRGVFFVVFRYRLWWWCERDPGSLRCRIFTCFCIFNSNFFNGSRSFWNSLIFLSRTGAALSNFFLYMQVPIAALPSALRHPWNGFLLFLKRKSSTVVGFEKIPLRSCSMVAAVIVSNCEHFLSNLNLNYKVICLIRPIISSYTKFSILF